MKKKLYLSGHNGLVGSSILRYIKKNLPNEFKVVTTSKKQLDLRIQSDVDSFFKKQKFDYVIIAAALVGGIHSNNTYPASYIYDNTMISSNIIKSSYEIGVKRLIFLGSSCIYPRLAKQPIKEEEINNGYLEPTNEPYAISKILGIKMCESFNRQYKTDFRSLMPCNLYGPFDNFNISNSHVIPALINKIHDAKIKNKKNVVIWGNGKPKREFLYVEDLAESVMYVLGLSKITYNDNLNAQCSHINIGTGQEITIIDLAKKISKIINFKGKIITDITKPNGTPRKILNINKIKKLGWSNKFNLDDGLKLTYQWYLENYLSKKLRK